MRDGLRQTWSLGWALLKLELWNWTQSMRLATQVWSLESDLLDTMFKKLGTVVHTCNPHTGALGRQRQRIPGAHWPDSLAELMSFRPMKNDLKMQGTWHMRTDVGVWLLFLSPCVWTRECIHTRRTKNNNYWASALLHRELTKTQVTGHTSKGLFFSIKSFEVGPPTANSDLYGVKTHLSHRFY